MRHTFAAEQWLPLPVDRVFAFFADPTNLLRITPRWQRLQIDDIIIRHAAESIAAAGAGTRITFSMRAFPFSPKRISWQAEIDEFKWNSHFCDKQVQGPFVYWQHCHRVMSRSRNEFPGTILLDELEYELPYGFLGELATNLFVARQIRSTFHYRQARTKEILLSAKR